MSEINIHWVKSNIINGLFPVFGLADAERVADDILSEVVEDIDETADDEFTTEDISISIHRILMKKLGYNE